MNVKQLINNGTINNISGCQVLITPNGEQVQQVVSDNTPDELFFDHLPKNLQSPRAQELWQELFKAGYVDSRCITTRSRIESSIIAKEMASKLGIKKYWNEFADLWNMSNLKSSYSKSHDTQNGWDFEKIITRLFA